MISRILVPTDFSDVANNALRFALQLADKCGAQQLDVLHVTHIPVMDASFPPDVYQSFMAEIEKTAKENFNKLNETILKGSKVKYVTHIVSGFVPEEIRAFGDKNQTDLVVMGTTGASGLQEVLVGSNAASVVAKSHVPIMVIPPSATYHDMKKMLYASDYTEPEFPALSRLIYFAELFDAEITILHVKSEYDRYFNSDNNFFVKNKEKISYPNWKIVKIDDASIMEGINRFIDKEMSDMLVLAKHNRNFFDRLFHRSLSKHMTYHTKIPLLVLTK